VGAMPERREAPRDLPVAKEVEQRGFLERFVTQRTVPERACGLSAWAALCSRGPRVAGPWWRGLGRAVKLSFPFS
jgi:hypothetical protein